MPRSHTKRKKAQTRRTRLLHDTTPAPDHDDQVRARWNDRTITSSLDDLLAAPIRTVREHNESKGNPR